MKEHLTTKTTCINGNFHTRLLNNDKVIDEMACSLKRDVGFCCAEMLRWYDKMGGYCTMAMSSRHRNHESEPIGKVWYRTQLPI